MAAMFTAVVIACLGLAQRSDAAVTWLVSESGGDVLLSTSGSLQLGGGFVVGTITRDWGGDVTDDLFGARGVMDRVAGAGSITGALSGLVGVSSTSTASGVFGANNASLFLEQGVYVGAATTITPVASMTFLSNTISNIFGSVLDSGPVVLWTANGSGDTISVALAPAATVPEPSTTALLGLGGLALMLRRRR